MDSHYGVHGGEEGHVREHMFEKPLTPSDVGKLNRLVIPKQHAEKYFPLSGGTGGGEFGGEKGLLLSFEDEGGKDWRFRYSYWTSSQSYVLTKGWSRFVKEKRLDAGDVVMFERTPRGERFYIGCRRRNSAAAATSVAQNAATTAAAQWSPAYYAAANYYGRSGGTLAAPYVYFSPMQTECQLLHRTGEQQGVTANNVPVLPGTSKRLIRLFGVNLEFTTDHENSSTSQLYP